MMICILPRTIFTNINIVIIQQSQQYELEVMITIKTVSNHYSPFYYFLSVCLLTEPLVWQTTCKDHSYIPIQVFVFQCIGLTVLVTHRKSAKDAHWIYPILFQAIRFSYSWKGPTILLYLLRYSTTFLPSQYSLEIDYFTLFTATIEIPSMYKRKNEFPNTIAVIRAPTAVGLLMFGGIHKGVSTFLLYLRNFIPACSLLLP